ncbi:DUF6074 family protein [Mesorhizobium sp.]|uniref:DUF6074 family protein n=1 Tax=Mesorhizobium sp. TaxID=1871066 RepID=UPI003BADBCD7
MHSAEVRVFPIDRQIVLVREVAAQLDKLHGDTATSFWKATAGELLDRVVGSGKDRASASDEVRRFFAAVQREMHTLTVTSPESTPKRQSAPLFAAQPITNLSVFGQV